MGSVLDVRKRLHRVRHPFHQSVHIKQGAWQCAALKPTYRSCISNMYYIARTPEPNLEHEPHRPRVIPLLDAKWRYARCVGLTVRRTIDNERHATRA